MSEQIFKGRVRLNSKSFEELQSSDFVLDNGEVAIATVPGSDASENIVLMKVGDGVNIFSSLPWVSALASDVYDWAKQEQKPTYNASEIQNLNSVVNEIINSITVLDGGSY